MKLLRAIIVWFLLVGVGFAQAPPFPPNPTVGEEVVGSNGAVYVWDGVKWVHGPPAPSGLTFVGATPPSNPPAGQLWFDTTNLQTYMWYNDGTSSQWVATVNIVGGGGGGGGGPFLTEDNPTFTGLMTGPALDIPSVATFNSQGLTIAGANTEAVPVNHSLAVGEPIPSDSDRAVIFTQGTYSATSAYNVWDAGTYLTSAGFKVSDPNGNIFHVYENAPAAAGHEIGWVMAHGLTPGDIWTGHPRSEYMALRDDANGGVPGLSVAIDANTLEQVQVFNSSTGNAAQAGVALQNDSGSVLYMLNEGSNYAAGGGSAQQPNAKGLLTSGPGNLFLQNNGGGRIDFNWGTIHTAFFYGQALVFPNNNYSQIQFNAYENPTGSILGHGDYGYIGMTGGGWYRGDGWIATAGSASAVTASQGNVTIAANHNLPVGGFYGPHNIAMFYHGDGGLSGLALGGWGAMVNGNGGLPALNIGQAYFGSETWANADISAGTYFNGQWVSTCGAGAGVSLFQITPYGSFQMLGAGPLGCGEVVPWYPIARWDWNGSKVTHIENVQDYGVPTCQNCAGLANGSRDTAGYVNAIAWPVHLIFAKAFTGNVACTGAALGQTGIVSFESNSTTRIHIRCNAPSGASCGAGWISYICMGMGG